LQKVRDLEERLEKFDLGIKAVALPDKELLLSLAQDLPAIWNSPSTDMRLKQRIVRILIEEIVADVEEASRQVVLLIHWAGGCHSELRCEEAGGRSTPLVYEPGGGPGSLYGGSVGAFAVARATAQGELTEIPEMTELWLTPASMPWMKPPLTERPGSLIHHRISVSLPDPVAVPRRSWSGLSHGGHLRCPRPPHAPGGAHSEHYCSTYDSGVPKWSIQFSLPSGGFSRA